VFIRQCCEYCITFYIISRVRSLICWENLRERSRLEDLGVDGRTIFKKRGSRNRMEGVDWIDLARYKERWGNLVDVIM
jgi:hypothetical protein